MNRLLLLNAADSTSTFRDVEEHPDYSDTATWDEAVRRASHTSAVLVTVSVILVLLLVAVVYSYWKMMNIPRRPTAIAVLQDVTDETGDSVAISYSDDGDLETGQTAAKECRKRQTKKMQDLMGVVVMGSSRKEG
jgi:hypothetical protein